jgi:hypothetical protein
MTKEKSACYVKAKKFTFFFAHQCRSAVKCMLQLVNKYDVSLLRAHTVTEEKGDEKRRATAALLAVAAAIVATSDVGLVLRNR